MYAEFASRDAVEKLRLDGAPTPRSWVARMTKRPNTNWCRQERLPAEARHVGSAAMSQNQVCGSYGPGHRMHWIQGKKSFEPRQLTAKVKAVAVHDDGRVDIEGQGLNLTLWYHDPDRLRSALRFGGWGEWKPKFHVLYVPSVGPFNLATPDRVQPCVPPIRRRPDETVRQFIERAMRENHGYTVPERWLADLDAIPDGDTGEPESGYLVGTNNPTPQKAALLRKLAKEFGHGPTTADPEDAERQRRAQAAD